MKQIRYSLPRQGMDFAKVISQKRLYVDKTDLVADLAGEEASFFFARPRGFGKSLLLSTLKELFEHGTQSFKGLKLEKEGLWKDRGSYKVIHLDFALIGDESESFEKDFTDTLRDAFSLACVTFVESASSWKSSLKLSLARCEARSLVLLIDEYDKPLTHVMELPDEFRRRRIVFSDFCQIIKDSVDKFRFTFITGVAGFHSYDVMANNVIDISFNHDYGAIAGFTKEELEQNFMPYIANAAEVLKQKEPQKQWDEQKILEELEQHCGGYSFDLFAEHRICNPGAAIDFLSFPEAGFKNTGFDNELLLRSLDNLIGQGATGGQGLGELPDFLALDFVKKSNKRNLSPVISNISKPNFPLHAILYQAGYLTIKRAEGENLYIGIPNHEVRQAFIGLVLERLTAGNIDLASDFIENYQKRVLDAFLNKDFPAMKDVMNDIIKDYSYESLKNFNEHMFRDVLKSSLNMLSLFELRCHKEEPSSKGRSDLTVECDNCKFVFELKVATDRKDAAAALQEAKTNEKNTPSVLREIVYLEEVDLNQRPQGRQVPEALPEPQV